VVAGRGLDVEDCLDARCGHVRVLTAGAGRAARVYGYLGERDGHSGGDRHRVVHRRRSWRRRSGSAAERAHRGDVLPAPSCLFAQVAGRVGAPAAPRPPFPGSSSPGSPVLPWGVGERDVVRRPDRVAGTCTLTRPIASGVVGSFVAASTGFVELAAEGARRWRLGR
jgi:hypothetical protein